MQIVDSTAPVPTQPTIPFRLKVIPGGPGGIVNYTYRQYPNGSLGDLVGDEERAFVRYAEFLEGRIAELEKQLTEARIGETPTPTSNGTPTADESASSVRSEDITSPTEAAEPSIDKRQRAEQELLSTPDASNGAIAARMGCSDEFVRKIRKAMEQEGRLEPIGNRKSNPSTDTTNASPAPEAVGVPVSDTVGAMEETSPTSDIGDLQQ